MEQTFTKQKLEEMVLEIEAERRTQKKPDIPKIALEALAMVREAERRAQARKQKSPGAIGWNLPEF